MTPSHSRQTRALRASYPIFGRIFSNVGSEDTALKNAADPRPKGSGSPQARSAASAPSKIPERMSTLHLRYARNPSGRADFRRLLICPSRLAHDNLDARRDQLGDLRPRARHLRGAGEGEAICMASSEV